MKTVVSFGGLVWLIVLLSVILCVAVGCDPAGSGTRTVDGNVQKGPFIAGSSITVQELDSQFTPIGRTYQTTTTDDLGSFSLGSQIRSDLIEIISHGFYFDEVGGNLSAANLTVRSAVDITVRETANVNILTSLARDRIGHLVQNEGLPFAAACDQAESEVLAAFHIGDGDVPRFASMDISEFGDGNAILLAVSAILQSDNTVAELSELIASFVLDIRSDGAINNAAIVSEIQANSVGLDLAAVRTNLADRYTTLGHPIIVPAFEDFVDSDGDGVINRDDPSPVAWQTLNPMGIARQQFVAAAVNGKLYAVGGVVSGPGTVLGTVEEYNPQDDSWTTKTAMPNPRYRAGGAVVGGLIYVIGGSGASDKVDVYNATNDEWSTQPTAIPNPRSQLAAAVVNDIIYVFGGQPTLTVDRYDPGDDSWTSMSATTTGREGFITASVSGKVYLIGGYSDALGSPVDWVEEYDPADDSFSGRTAMPTSRDSLTGLSDGSLVYAIGGWPGGGSSYNNEVEIYNPTTNTWATGTAMPTARRGAASALLGGDILVIGGENVPDENLAVLESYTPADD